MAKQTATPTVVRVRETGAQIIVTEDEHGPRWECSGCSHGRAEDGALEAAEVHAEHCAVLPLS
ncbi:hypothetical protein QMA61_18220 [Streptomyces coelicoflavus]|uniref:hypothetical protein n=1 Tax=Streptomyces coelicoflavus TaxID=285562 RepID=UPI0024AE09A8|nr:hypothetical protein [Streptomyces coelicoflavus]MDI6518131.1 hypothetical protein [Streptomyces coelicoflavus]